MDEFKRVPFGGNPYAHFEFTNRYKVDVQGIFYPALIHKAVVQVHEMEHANIANSSHSETHADN